VVILAALEGCGTTKRIFRAYFPGVFSGRILQAYFGYLIWHRTLQIMDKLQNDCFLRALERQPVERTPVWLMRQAGRYLPEYRQTRARAGSFMNLCRTPELACEVTLQPLERFKLDAAILFSDILTIPDALGLGLEFHEGEGPHFTRTLDTAADIAALGHIDPQIELRYVMDAVRLIRHELRGRVPLIGFAGSPWTLATYMVEGGSSSSFTKIKSLMYTDPAAMHQLLELLAQSVADYLRAQQAEGAQALMIFDTWGGILTPRDYQDFSLQYMAKIVAALRTDTKTATTPVILFSKGAGQCLESIAATGCAGVGIDWTTAIDDAFKRIGGSTAIQGNMDPCVLYAPETVIRAEVAHILDAVGSRPGHVMNLGHGIQPGMQPEAIGTFVQAVHDLSPSQHPAQE